MAIFERIFKNWKTTAGAVLCLAIFFWAYYEGLIPHDGLSGLFSKLLAGVVTSALLLSKDKKTPNPNA